MIYKKPLNQNQTLLMILNKRLHNSLSKYIIYLKIKYEKNDILEYYNQRWLKIAKEHYYLHKNHMGKFSIIHDSKIYIIKKDFKLDYFKYTGISYQIIELIHQLIKLKNDKYLTKDQGYKYWLNYDDKLYTLLATKITNEMNKHTNPQIKIE